MWKLGRSDCRFWRTGCWIADKPNSIQESIICALC
jgi:hypothetical protein